ncbi:hypothetical protein EGW08_003295 [Elysia chlorotica]|uniref:Uncharacterized protein n=1 Tax=Elysia chlorotica TaxID=188477 RepID=A0A433U547_ELYCH|nr:hypothetical protein EGW08_003295 [Elysia chlorotica]
MPQAGVPNENKAKRKTKSEKDIVNRQRLAVDSEALLEPSPPSISSHSSKKELLRANTMPAISVSSVLTAEELRQHGVASTTGSSGTTNSGAPDSRGSSSSGGKSGKHSSSSNSSGGSNSSGPTAVGVAKESVYRRSSASSSGSCSPHISISPRRVKQQPTISHPPPSGLRKLSYTEAYLGCMRTLAGSAEPSPSSSGELAA